MLPGEWERERDRGWKIWEGGSWWERDDEDDWEKEKGLPWKYIISSSGIKDFYIISLIHRYEV